MATNLCRARTRQLFARKFGEKGMIKLSTYVAPLFFRMPNSRSSKHTKSVILLILWATRLSKRVYHTSTTMARLVLFSTLRGVQLVFRVKRLLETDTLRKDCMSVLNMFDTPDVVMVYIFC